MYFIQLAHTANIGEPSSSAEHKYRLSGRFPRRDGISGKRIGIPFQKPRFQCQMDKRQGWKITLDSRSPYSLLDTRLYEEFEASGGTEIADELLESLVNARKERVIKTVESLILS